MASYFGTYFGRSGDQVFPMPSFDSPYDMVKHSWQSFLDIADVTYQDTHQTASGVKARKCLPRQSELERLDSFASQVELATFILWDSTLSGAVPKGNGKIVYKDNTVWTIQALWKEQFETQWRCLCRKDQ